MVLNISLKLYELGGNTNNRETFFCRIFVVFYYRFTQSKIVWILFIPTLFEMIYNFPQNE